MLKLQELESQSAACRKTLTEMIYLAKSGHIGGSLSETDILVALYFGIMKIRPEEPLWPERDRFVLSKGHSVEAYYAVLAARGFFPESELRTYGQFGSRLLGHPNKKVPGVEINTGALGHGLPVAVGMAISGKLDGKNFRVFALMGDGELAEGSVWEGAMAAANYGLDHLIAVIDRNRLQISGPTEQVMRLENLADKWRSFGWDVEEADGNDMETLIRVLSGFQANGKPHLLIADTVKGKGVSFMENRPEWHHGVLNEEQYRQAIRELSAQEGGCRHE